MPSTGPARAATSDWLLFLVPSFIWGTTWYAIKFQLGVVAPELSVAYRFGLAALLLLGWSLASGQRLRFDRRTHASFLVLGLLQFALNYVLVYLSEAYLTSGLVALIFSLLVLWNILGARLFFSTRLTARVVAGAAIGLAGVTLVVWPDLTHLGDGRDQALGALLALLGTLAASAANLWSQRLYRRGLPVVGSTAWSMAYGSGLVALSCALRGIPFTFDASPPYLISLGYLALFGSVFAFVSYLTLLKRIGAGRAGYTSALTTVLAMVTSTVFEGYRWTALAVAGMVLVLGGNVLILSRRDAAQRA